MSLSKVLKEWDIDPFQSAIWPDLTSPVTREEIAEAIASGAFLLGGDVPSERLGEANRAYHIRRIAWLAVNGWDDPIDADFGIPVLNYYPDWPILDGNHRLAAALYRGDETILVDPAGQVDWFETFMV